MKKLFYIIFFFVFILLGGCRKVPRGQRGRTIPNKDVIIDRQDNNQKEENRKLPKNEDYDSSNKDENMSENDEDLNVTPKSTDERNTFWSANGYENIEMVKKACDFNVPKTKGFANKLAGKAIYDDANFNIEQICEIFEYCYTKWRYVNDPKGSEYLAKASETIISSLTGDCDDFAILVASCMLAIGGDVSIVLAYGNQGGHAYAEVDISRMNKNYVETYIKKRFNKHSISSIFVRNEGNRQWLNLDWQADYPGGPLFSANKHYYYSCIDGKWSYHS